MELISIIFDVLKWYKSIDTMFSTFISLEELK